MQKKLFYIFLSFIAAGVLLFIGFKYFLSEPQIKLLYSIPLINHFISFIFCLAAFIISGYELKYIYERNSNLKLSTYEVISIPISMNLWGFIIPFQGAYLYLITYLKLKHKTSVLNSTYIYAYLFLVSLSISGLLGVIFYLSYSSVSFLFLCLSILLLINPFIIFIISKLVEMIDIPDIFFLKKTTLLIKQITNNMSVLFKDKPTTIIMIGFNLLSTFFYAIWSYWVVVQFNLNVSFFAVLLMTFLLKITMLVKFTPGNLGLIQLASGAIIALLGGKASDGFMISLFQSLTTILMAFSLGVIFTINNFSYLKWNELKKIFSKL